MERHRCKLCFKNFVNGKALGGHMRSHMLNLYVPPKTEQPSESLAELDSVSSSSDEELEAEAEAEDDEGLFGYGLRENPKKSLRLVDPDFSDFQGKHDHHQAAQAGSSVFVQDRESETETSKNPNPVRRRSKRVRKSGNFELGEFLKSPEMKKAKMVKLSSQTELASWVDPEPVSSISDTTTEEDVAYSLMKLSRDKWGPEKELADYDNDENEEDQEYYEQSDNESDHDHEVKVISKATKGKGKYKCDTCNKVFKSYQALGGHRASHKKVRLNHNKDNHNLHGNSSVVHDLDREVVVEEKIHECPVCFRVFASGQALGGHKRSHVIGSSATIGRGNNAGLVHAKPVAKQGEMSLIDLNLPAPMEDEDEISISAVSDGEFVKIH